MQQDLRSSDPAERPVREPAFDQPARFARLVLLLGVGYLLFATFRPFFSAVLWASVFAYGLHPVYRRLLRALHGQKTLSALIMSVAVTVGLILPVVYLSFLIGEQLARTYTAAVSALYAGPPLVEQWRGLPITAAIERQIHEFERLTGSDLRAVLASNLADLGRAFVQQLTRLARNFLTGIAELGVILLSTFYFFRDGEDLLLWARDLIPLTAERQRLVGKRFGEVVYGAVYANSLVAVLEGAVGAVAFWLADLPAALLWGTIMAILAYLPIVGAALVWGPAAVYLVLQHAYVEFAIVLVAGVVITILDYIVRNVVVGGALNIHTLVAFFGVLGGIQLFGLVGIVAGPLVVAVGIALLESYRQERPAAIVAPSGADPSGR